MTRQLQDVLAQIQSLEPLPEVAARVLSISSRRDVVPGELVAIIQTDVAMTAKVLRLTNSAYYGFQREIGSLRDAGNLLGVSVLVNLVLTACTGRYFRRNGASDSEASRQRWERSVENALATSLFARLHGGVDANRAYTAGLLQDLGVAVLEPFLATKQRELERASEQGLARVEAEAEVAGIDHAEVGARMCERWSFPEALVDTVRHHHAPERATHDPLLAHFVHLADEVTAALALEHGADRASGMIHESAFAWTGLDATGLESLRRELSAEIRQAKDFIALA